MPNKKKYKGEKHEGHDHSSPYPVSRQSPAIELVELAKEVAKADDVLSIQAVGKLRMLAEQIEALQEKAQEILADTRRNQQLHRVPCGVKKRVGEIYYLYRRSDETMIFSIVSPQEWGEQRGESGLNFLGSYRLEADRSFTPVEVGRGGRGL